MAAVGDNGRPPPGVVVMAHAAVALPLSVPGVATPRGVWGNTIGPVGPRLGGVVWPLRCPCIAMAPAPTGEDGSVPHKLNLGRSNLLRYNGKTLTHTDVFCKLEPDSSARCYLLPVPTSRCAILGAMARPPRSPRPQNGSMRPPRPGAASSYSQNDQHYGTRDLIMEHAHETCSHDAHTRPDGHAL